MKYLEINTLCKQVEKNFESFISRHPQSNQQEKIINILRKYKESSTSGNIADRSILKAHIKTGLLTGFDLYEMDTEKSLSDRIAFHNFTIDADDSRINDIIPFDDANSLTAQEKFSIILYLNNEENSEGRSKAFKHILSRYRDFEKMRTDGKGSWHYTSKRYEYSAEDINRIYLCEIESQKLSFADKLEIIVQIIYEKLFGLGSLDVLAYSDVNEIGFSNDGKYIYCWCDVKVWLSFLELSAEDARVIQDRAISFDGNAGQLDESSPEKLCYRGDLARITVTQQPYSSARNLCTRIFNQRHLSLKELMPDEELLTVITALVRSGASICLQGGLGTGKTTTMSAMFELLDDSLHIGIVEDFLEQHIMQKYPNKRVVELKSLHNKSLEDAVKTILRLSVDVADLGEVRNGDALFNAIQLIQAVSMAAWFTVHVSNPETTVTRFKNMLLGTGRYSTEQSAVMDIVHYVNLIFQHDIVDGKRMITEIVEIVPTASTSFGHDFNLDLNTSMEVLQKLYYIQQIQSNPQNMYRLNRILDARDGVPKLINYPSNHLINKVRQNKAAWPYMEELLQVIDRHKARGKTCERT